MKPAKADAVIAWEGIGTALDNGLEDLIALNQDEVETDDFPLDIDWPKYLALERAGMYRSVSVRRGGKLIGYRSFIVSPPMRHQRSLWAVNDALYLDPTERKGLLAVRLVNTSDDLLRDLKADVVIQGDRKPFNSTAEKRRATFGDLLQRFCGYRPTETVFAKRL